MFQLFDWCFSSFFRRTGRRRTSGGEIFWRTAFRIFNFRQRISPEGEMGVLKLGRRAGVRLEVYRRAVQRRKDVVDNAALAGISEKFKLLIKSSLRGRKPMDKKKVCVETMQEGLQIMKLANKNIWTF